MNFFLLMYLFKYRKCRGMKNIRVCMCVYVPIYDNIVKTYPHASYLPVALFSYSFYDLK